MLRVIKSFAVALLLFGFFSAVDSANAAPAAPVPSSSITDNPFLSCPSEFHAIFTCTEYFPRTTQVHEACRPDIEGLDACLDQFKAVANQLNTRFFTRCSVEYFYYELRTLPSGAQICAPISSGSYPAR